MLDGIEKRFGHSIGLVRLEEGNLTIRVGGSIHTLLLSSTDHTSIVQQDRGKERWEGEES